jgi:hypothetical protein
MRGNLALIRNLLSCGHCDWCPDCGEPMDWFCTPNERWNICDGCRVAFCPAWGIGLGASSEGWEAQLH